MARSTIIGYERVGTFAANEGGVGDGTTIGVGVGAVPHPTVNPLVNVDVRPPVL